jgi:hypothetical protein
MFSFGGKSGHRLALAEKEEAWCPSQNFYEILPSKNFCDILLSAYPRGMASFKTVLALGESLGSAS